MYLLYLDGSGSAKNPDERHFVLAGVAVFERQIYHLIRETDDFVESLGLGDPHDIELHSSVIAHGKGSPWKGMMREERLEIIKGGLNLLSAAHNNVKAFAVVVDKASVPDDDPVEYAFEEICSRFDLFLRRLHHRDDTQRGLIIMDESHYEDSLQGLARHFRENGARWGKDFRNLAEVPLFVDSAASRLIQLADLLARAVWRRYEHGDTRDFDLIAHRFDKDRGVMHGLVHRKRPEQECTCPACATRGVANYQQRK